MKQQAWKDPWLAVVVIGLGAMKVTELIKEATPWPLQPWTKSVVSISLATAGCAMAFEGSDRVVAGIGCAGVAAMAHEIRDTMSARGDTYKQEVFLRSQRRR